MLRPLLAAALFLGLAASAFATPLTLKELDLMVRMRVPEAEIMRDLGTRRLLVPLDAVTEQGLVQNGASAALIARLKSGSDVVSSTDAATVQQQQAIQQAAIAKAAAEDDAAFLAREIQSRQAPPPVSDAMRTLLDGKLVRMESGDLRAFSSDELKHVRCYALYYSAHWCAPCREFTPKLVEFYKRFKAQHPDFEVIFISNDYNPAGMQTYMKSAGMPWPAVKYEQIDARLKGLAGKGIPWLAFYNDAGQPLSSNGSTKEWADPTVLLREFEQQVNRTAAR